MTKKPVYRINLMAERVKRGLTVQEVGQAIGANPNTIRTWETGEFAPDAEHLARLCKLYKADPEYLLMMEGNCDG